MSAVILLSSDEDSTDEPPKKRLKPTLVEERVKPTLLEETSGPDAYAVIISSDDDSEKYENSISSSNICKADDVYYSEEENATGIYELESNMKIENGTDVVDLDNTTDSYTDNESLKSPTEPESHTNEYKITNVNTNNVDDNLPASLPNGKPLIDALYSAGRFESSQQNDLALSVTNAPEVDLPRSSPCGSTSADRSSPENQIADESRAAAGPLENQGTVDEMDAFLKTCSRSVEKTKYESLREKFSVLSDLYQKYILNKGYNDEVGSFIREHIVEASKSAADAVLTFNEVLEYFKTADIEEVEIAPEYRKKVKILLKTCIKLIHKIKKLECAEVDWDDDNNSAYIQEDRYKKRLVKVFNLYCKYVRMNPYQGRLTHRKLNFSASSYKEINVAINKNCHKHGKFPSYRDIEQIVRKCVNKYDLPLPDSKIKRESEKCFKTVGRFLQKRRKQELYESHFYFIKDTNDPASFDQQLDKCLKQNFAEGMRKIEMICERYAEKQMEQSQAEPSEEETGSESSNEESDSS